MDLRLRLRLWMEGPIPCQRVGVPFRQEIAKPRAKPLRLSLGVRMRSCIVRSHSIRVNRGAVGDSVSEGAEMKRGRETTDGLRGEGRSCRMRRGTIKDLSRD